MKGYIMEIRCASREVAKNVEAGIRFGGSGHYEKPDDLRFRVNMNPMHAGLLCAVCQNMARLSTTDENAVTFWHDGEQLTND